MDNIKVLYILIAIIFLISGITVGILISGNLNKKSDLDFSLKYNLPNTFESGWKAAKKKIEETPYIPATTTQGEEKTIKGRIIKIESNQITIEARLLNPLDDEKLKTRIVKIDKNTKIVIKKMTDRETMKKEHDDYNKKMEDYRNDEISKMPQIPKIFSEINGSIENLEEGQTVTIKSEENIKDALEFNASNILIR